MMLRGGSGSGMERGREQFSGGDTQKERCLVYSMFNVHAFTGDVIDLMIRASTLYDLLDGVGLE